MEMPVPSPVGVLGFGVSQWSSRSLRVPVSEFYPYSRRWSSSPVGRPVLSGLGVLLPGRCRPAAPVQHASRGRGRDARMVPVPGSHLFSSADDGCRSLSVGSQKSPQKLHAYDSVQGGLNIKSAAHWTSGLVYVTTEQSFSYNITNLELFCNLS